MYPFSFPFFWGSLDNQSVAGKAQSIQMEIVSSLATKDRELGTGKCPHTRGSISQLDLQYGHGSVEITYYYLNTGT